MVLVSYGPRTQRLDARGSNGPSVFAARGRAPDDKTRRRATMDRFNHKNPPCWCGGDVVDDAAGASSPSSSSTWQTAMTV